MNEVIAHLEAELARLEAAYKTGDLRMPAGLAPGHMQHTFAAMSALKAATSPQDRAEYEARLRQIVTALRQLNPGKAQ